ncbi:MAG: hypothetical protein QXS96_08255 [Candidatus Caldarchaeum sp.]
MKAGRGKADALRRARLEMLEEGRFMHPFFGLPSSWWRSRNGSAQVKIKLGGMSDAVAAIVADVVGVLWAGEVRGWCLPGLDSLAAVSWKIPH